MNAPTVGVIGVGRMGLPIARHLSDAGLGVRVWDTDAARRDAAIAARLSVARTAEDVAEGVDVLLTVLPDAVAVSAALLGDGPDGDQRFGDEPGGDERGEARPRREQPVGQRVGALARLRPGSVWLDLTSNDPREATAMAERARDAGIRSVAAPMGGGPEGAERGELTLYVAGEPDAVESVSALLAVVAASVVPVGAVVAHAHAVKLLANLLWFDQAVAVTEAMLLGTALGLDAGMLRRALAGSAGGSVFIDRHLPALLAGDYLEQFGIDGVVGELDVLSALARDVAVPFTLGDHVTALHREALDRFGPVGGELLAAKLLEERAGRTLAASTRTPR